MRTVFFASVVGVAAAIETIVINAPGVDLKARPEIIWPDHNASDVKTIEARAFQGCSARTSYGDFCGWANAWEDLWGIRDNICNHKFETSGGPVRYVYNAWAGSGAAEIQQGMTSQYCWGAFSDILWTCFNTDTGPTGDDKTALSGTWDNGHEWYWLWGDEHYFARRDDFDDCCTDGPGCRNRHI